MRDCRNEEETTLAGRLKIGVDDIPGCGISFTRDCLDQTILYVELPAPMSRPWAEEISIGGVLSWVANGMFIVDRPHCYRLTGCVGNRSLNVRFRVFNIDPFAWEILRKLIISMLENNSKAHEGK